MEQIEKGRPTLASYVAVGGPAAVSTSDQFSNDAAVRILQKGGSAVDAMIAAAATQCVVANGSTSLAGMWVSNSFDSSTGKTITVSSKISAPAAESYDFDADGPEGWGGRSMPIPSWVNGAYRAWEHGGRLKWSELFDTAIELADGYECNLGTYLRVRGGGFAVSMAARMAEGREIWMRDGRYIQLGESVRQPALARTLRALAYGGPAAFYEGEFAQHYVDTSRSLGGRLTMADLAAWPEIPIVEASALLGDYCESQIVTEGGLMVYALHLAQAASLEALDEVEAVYAQVRIMEEVFCATEQFSPATRDQFIDRSYADMRIDEVLHGPVRPNTFDQFWANTQFLAVRDGDGSSAWVVHSINTSSIYGAGIIVDGAYAVRAISESHARTGDLLQPGLFAYLALYRDGRPHLIAGSPGWGVMHGPLSVTMARVQRKLEPFASVCAPRFALPNPATAGRPLFESHYPRAVFQMLEDRGLPYFTVSPSGLTGLVASIILEGDMVHALHDVRADGSAVAFAP